MRPFTLMRLATAIGGAVIAIAVVPSPTMAQCDAGGYHVARYNRHRGHTADVHARRTSHFTRAGLAYGLSFQFYRPAYSYRSDPAGASFGYNRGYARGRYGHRYGYRSPGSHSYGRPHGGGSQYRGGHH